MAHLKRSGHPDLVCMGFLCIEPDARGIGNVLVITDHYTRYAQAFPTKDQKPLQWPKFYGRGTLFIIDYPITCTLIKPGTSKVTSSRSCLDC
ncbi:hypothetical protein FKM82_019872 [Ascaphus truei]